MPLLQCGSKTPPVQSSPNSSGTVSLYLREEGALKRSSCGVLEPRWSKLRQRGSRTPLEQSHFTSAKKALRSGAPAEF
jgi:hypothetical protein